MIKLKRYMTSRKKTIVIFSFLLLLFFAGSVYGTEVDWPTSPLTRISLSTNSEFQDFIAYAYGWGIGLGGILTFTMLVYAGIEYMTSIGNPSKQAKAKARIGSTFFGLILLLTSWLILHTINPQITTLSPLPPLWSDDMFEDEKILYDSDESLPCEFVIFYEQPNFSGTSTEPIYPGENENTDILTEFQSGRAFRKMSEEEKITLAELGEDFFRGREIYNGEYIDPGPCIVTMYEEKKEGWFKKNACGKIIGTITFPNKNFAHTILQDADEIDCFVVEDVEK
jgi:hypothetical protein